MQILSRKGLQIQIILQIHLINALKLQHFKHFILNKAPFYKPFLISQHNVSFVR